MSALKFENNGIRFDLQIIASWIEPGARVLDLGCGEGDLLNYLAQRRQIAGTGIERVEARVAAGIEKGLSVLHGDINTEILDYADNSFDYVILSQTLQQVYAPDNLIGSMMRVGRRAIVSFPNFSHWGVRLQVIFTGYAPITQQLPYQWYDTPNIRVITLKDFRKFAHDVGVDVLKEVAINTHSQNRHGTIIRIFPNLRATYGIFMVGKRQGKRLS